MGIWSRFDGVLYRGRISVLDSDIRDLEERLREKREERAALSSKDRSEEK